LTIGRCSIPLFFFAVLLRRPLATPFPYTTLFRSVADGSLGAAAAVVEVRAEVDEVDLRVGQQMPDDHQDAVRREGRLRRPRRGRSEEHTSELQSQAYLVCRLLLEKKNT